MRFRVCIALLLLVSACAGVPAPPSRPRPHAFVLTPPLDPSTRLVSALREPVQPSSRIEKADLVQARVLLSRARNDLEPLQWDALNSKLTAAEQAFERFSKTAKASGQTTEVSRWTEGFAKTGHAKTLTEALPRVGPLLAVLILLYPSSTAPAEIDRRPEWVDARREYETRLRDVAEESRRLMEELVPEVAEEGVPGFDLEPVEAVAAPTDWRTETNPATGNPYTSVEEYDRIPRHANQTCKNSRLDELEAEKKLLSKSVPPYNPKAPRSTNKRKLDEVPCSRIRLRLQAMNKVLEKRWEIQKECFGGKPDPGHSTTMTELEQGIASTKGLEVKNCAPGHPMADK